ncbi:uncharacterized protein LOC116433524 isoform X1 [Nomia melanderi]|uniref:uncharacterized protein LOC116433524 isoform X1 n=1 Tax=Nomia melanderi TaxID=2448451 RepID=UPI003FCDB2AC
MPRLRKDRGHKTRWGVQYYAAVRNAVFMIRTPPYVPPEPPPSLNKHECDTLYVCPQCKDRFHFRSSLEDHRVRKSWILGYWCQHCFMTVCNHEPKERSLCSVCSSLEREKRMYLKNRGLHKTQRFGSVQLFFNQCQFLAHLKAHSITNVNMSDLMLMPIPTNLTQNWDPEINIICEALMEHTFIKKVHIMDWLKDENIVSNWWQVTNKERKDDNDVVRSILKDYKGHCYFPPIEIPVEEQVYILNNKSVSNFYTNCSNSEMINTTENADKMKNSSSVDSTTLISDDNEIENEDTPCTVNDIAFVDCGPASNFFESESSVSNISKRRTTITTKSSKNLSNVSHITNVVVNKAKKVSATQWNSISSNTIMSYGNTMITPKFGEKDSSKCVISKKSTKNVIDKSNKGTTPMKLIRDGISMGKGSKRISEKNVSVIESVSKVEPDTSSCAIKTETCKNKLEKPKQNTPVVTVNSAQKFVTLQNTVHIDINKIINQLQPRVVGNKKIYLIGQDSKSIVVHNTDDKPSKKSVQLVPDANHENGVKNKVLSSDSSEIELIDKDVNKSVQTKPTESVAKKPQFIRNKIVCHNGQKYIIKQTPGAIKPSKSRSSVNRSMKKEYQAVLWKSTCSIPPLIPIKRSDTESLSTPERINSLHGDTSPLTPSPSPSELSSSSSCDVQSKQSILTTKSTLKTDASNSSNKSADVNMKERNSTDSVAPLTFYKGEDQNLYLDMKYHPQKPIYTIVDSASMIMKTKHEMLNEFFHLTYAELKKRYDHLQQLNSEILAVMDFVPDNMVKERLKKINILEHVLKHCMDKCSDKVEDSGTKDRQLEDWELEYNLSAEKTFCKACKKPRKPEYYIPGFSKSTKNDIYCSCYRHVCHQCDTYQGNSTRFVAHQTFHDKEKPYLCPDCYRKFLAFTSLEAHTWTSCFHPLKKRVLGCKICEIDGFRDMETVARHFAVMHSHNRIACEKCYIVLPSYTEYQKHHKEKHSDTDDEHPIRLVLCKLGRCIVRCEEYMLHMEKHLVVQRLIWFTCPFCTFIHVEAKRIMAHLQSEHLSQLFGIISPRVLWKILPPDIASSFLNGTQQSIKSSCLNEESSEDRTIMPKIVNTRTITSEVFERGTEEVVEYLPVTDSGQRPKVNKKFKAITKFFSEFNESLPKILEVRSIAEQSSSDASDSPINESAIESVKGMEDVAARKEVKTDTKRLNDLTESEHEISIEDIKLQLSPGNREVKDEHATEIDLSKLTTEPAQQDSSSYLRKDALLSTNKDAAKTDTIDQKPSCEIGDAKETEIRQTNDTFNNSSRLLKPPPLARIPQRVLEPEQTSKTEGRPKVFSRSQKTSRHFYQRIALNGPLKAKETVLNFFCPLCGDLINTSWSVVSSHFEQKHRQDCKLVVVNPTLVRMSQEFINDGYKDLLGNRKRKSDNASTNTKRRRRWTPKKYSEGRNANFAGIGLCVTQETAEDSEGKFRCKKCDQRCSNMIHLREHIATDHRIRGRYLICLECGDNFVVAPSLQMHLKAFHGIEDPIAYMAKNPSYAPDSIEDLDVEGKAIEANQCHVCMAVFENKAAVDKHLRVHGMAFLNRKRIEAQNAMKSPEKKNGTDEEKQVPEATTGPKVPVRKGKPAETILDKITATM